MSQQDFIGKIKQTIYKNNLNTGGDPSEPTPKMNQADPFAPTSAEEKSEQLRATVFVVGIFIFLGVMAYQFLGRRWVNELIQDPNLNYVILGVAALASLIAMRIVMGILRGILSLFMLNQDIGGKLKGNPILKILFFGAGICIWISLFFVSLKVISQGGMSDKINDFLKNGFEFTVDTDDGENVIKMEDGNLKIENEAGEVKQFKVMNVR